MPLPTYETISLPHSSSDRPDWGFLPMGVDPSGTVTGLNLKDSPHTAVVGRAGSGKTVLLRTLVHAALLRGFGVHIAALATPGNEYTFAEPMCEGLATDLEKAGQLVAGIRDYTTNLNAVRREHGVTSWNDMPTVAIRPPQLLVVDGLGALLPAANNMAKTAALKEAIIDSLTTIARTGRSEGIYLVLAAQLMDSALFPPALRANLRSRVQLGKTSALRAHQALHGEQACELALTVIEPGMGVLDVDGQEPQKFQGYFAPTSGDFNADF